MKRPSLSQRDSIRKRASNSCEKCGRKIKRFRNGRHNGSIHHRHMRRMGGSNIPSNLVLLCLTCHKGVHLNEPQAALTGWVAWVDPEMTPLRLHDGWALLVPDGTYERLGEEEALRLLSWVNGCAMGSGEGLAEAV